MVYLWVGSFVQYSNWPRCANANPMSEPAEHLKIILAEIHQIGADGHLNKFKATVAAELVEYAIARLKEVIEDEDNTG